MSEWIGYAIYSEAMRMNIAGRILIVIASFASAVLVLAWTLPRPGGANTAQAARATAAETAKTVNPESATAGSHPFQGTCSSENSGLETLSCRIVTPAGFRLVVENVSVWVSNATPSNTYVVSTVNNYLASTYIPLVAQEGLNFMASTPVKLYVDAGAGVRCGSVVNTAAGQITCTISGYLAAI
jgi:hypothetical protein